MGQVIAGAVFLIDIAFDVFDIELMPVLEPALLKMLVAEVLKFGHCLIKRGRAAGFKHLNGRALLHGLHNLKAYFPQPPDVAAGDRARAADRNRF